MSVATFYIILYITASTIGVIIGIVVPSSESKQNNSYRNFITKKEYEIFMRQTIGASSVAHGGGRLCPDKNLFDLVQDGSKRSEFKFPSVDF